MAKAEYLKALIRSFSEGDREKFYSIALQLAAQEARQGHVKYAQELRELIEQAQRKNTAPKGQQVRPMPIIQPRGDLAGLLQVSYPKTRFVDMALNEEVKVKIDRVILEQQMRNELREYGLSPLRKLLLVGPPGTGKTMTASALAGELLLPLFTIQLDGIITKYLGETAAKLRLIFDAIKETRAVYFFDEFDALGSERTAPNEVGEIRRALNSFLQFIEEDVSDSLILAATNHPQLLDRALFRRFDLVIPYHLPNRQITEIILRRQLLLFDVTKVNWETVLHETEGLSHADIVRAGQQVAKSMILENRREVDTSDVVHALKERKKVSELGW